MFLFRDTLFCTYCWFISIELMASGPVCHSRIKITYHTCFLRKAHHSLPELRTTRQCKQHFSTILGDHFKRQNRQQNAQKCEQYGTKLWKYTGLEYENWNKRQSIALFDLGCGCERQVTQIFHHSTQVFEWYWKPCEYWYWAYK